MNMWNKWRLRWRSVKGNMVQLTDDAPNPRLCRIEKTEPSQEYGYNLHAEKGRGQFVGLVDKGSPADIGGLRTGDRIFAVNGQSIVGLNHKQVVSKIKEHSTHCQMLVLDEEAAKWYAERNIPVTLQLPNIVDGSKKSSAVNSRRQTTANGSPPPAADWYAPANNATNDPVFVAPPPPNHSPNMNKPYPLLCHLNKHSSSDEFGFNLHAEKNHGHFIGTVDEGGIGSSAGLKMGQRIVGVNNTLIYPTTPHKDVVGYIKSNPMETSLLVVSEDTDAWYKSHNEPFSFSYSKPGVEPQPQQLSPHSIQISDEEVEQVSPVPKLEEHVPVQYDVPPSHINAQYDLPPPTRYDTVPDEVINSDDLMAAVFGNTPITTDVVVTSPDLSREERAATQPHLETHGGHSRAPSVDPSEVSFHHESAVDVPHNYNAYADSHVYDKHREYSAYSHDEPKSNGFSHHSVSPSVDESDIFNLSASEARKRLQHKKDRRGLDMTLDEKYHLVSNM